MEKPLLEKVAQMMMSSDEEMANLGKDIFFRSSPTEEDVDMMNEIFPPLTPGKPHFYMASKRTHIESYQEIDIENISASLRKKPVDIFEGMKKYK